MSDPAETQHQPPRSGDGDEWKDAFLAVSAAIGDAPEDALASIDAGGESDRARALGDGDRDVRARSLASAIARIVQDLDAMRLA